MAGFPQRRGWHADGFADGDVCISWRGDDPELLPAEATNPKSRFPMRSNSVFWRILIFYVGAPLRDPGDLSVEQIGTNGNPSSRSNGWASNLRQGLSISWCSPPPLSSCNGGIYSTGRMLYNLMTRAGAAALSKHFTRRCTSPGDSRYPVSLLFGVLLNYLVPAKVFVWVTSIATFGAIWTWTVILLSQMKFRKSLSGTERDRLAFACLSIPTVRGSH